PGVVQLGFLGGGGNRAGRGLSAVAVPAHHAGRDQGKERLTEGPFVARDRGVRSADRVGLLDRLEPATLFPGVGAAGGADRGTRSARVLCGTASAESAGGGKPGGAVAITFHAARPCRASSGMLGEPLILAERLD